MVFRCMVHDKVHADMDSFFVTGKSQAFQIFHGSKFFFYSPKIGNGIAAVRTAVRRF